MIIEGIRTTWSCIYRLEFQLIIPIIDKLVANFDLSILMVNQKWMPYRKEEA